MLIANIFLGATAMGTLAVSKTIPIAILSLVSVVSTVFLPDFTKYYAKEDTIGLINAIKKSGKWMPAIQNGKQVKAYRTQPITFSVVGG